MNTRAIKELEEHLRIGKSSLKGKWVQMNSSYDRYICECLDMKCDNARYWDALWNGRCIEFKKGKSIWLDLVRYSEIVLKLNEDASKDTFNLFFVPNQDRTHIDEIIGVSTSRIISKLDLDEKFAEKLVALRNIVPRSLNAQASLTLRDIRGICSFTI